MTVLNLDMPAILWQPNKNRDKPKTKTDKSTSMLRMPNVANSMPKTPAEN